MSEKNSSESYYPIGGGIAIAPSGVYPVKMCDRCKIQPRMNSHGNTLYCAKCSQIRFRERKRRDSKKSNANYYRTHRETLKNKALARYHAKRAVVTHD
jgi:ribosomal protein S27AE